jgi:8-oxo-dGTP pyrophosphatase MutT (NUDIX family)
MSDYIRGLREKIGTTVLEVPTVSILTFDVHERALLVRHVEGNDWSTPGGMIEPYETPANAAVREMWEETGLFVELTHIIGVAAARCLTSRSRRTLRQRRLHASAPGTWVARLHKEGDKLANDFSKSTSAFRVLTLS